MAFLAPSAAKIAFDKVSAERERILLEAQRAKDDLGSVGVRTAMQLHNALMSFQAAWDEAKSVPGIGDYAASATTQDKASLVSDYEAVRGAGTPIVTWVRANIASSIGLQNGYIRNLPLDMTSQSDNVDALIAAIEG